MCIKYESENTRRFGYFKVKKISVAEQTILK